MRAELAVFCLGVAALAAASARAGEPPDPRGKGVVPEAANEGARDATIAARELAKAVRAQPYGKNWKDIVHVDPVPKDRKGLGEASTHPDLRNDPMELQQQAQYLEETGGEARFGFVSLRVVRVYNFGKLAASRLVMDQIGKDKRTEFIRDLETLAAAWTDPPAALGLGGAFQVTKNDLVEQKAKRPTEYPAPPLVIELRPMERGGR